MLFYQNDDVGETLAAALKTRKPLKSISFVNVKLTQKAAQLIFQALSSRKDIVSLKFNNVDFLNSSFKDFVSFSMFNNNSLCLLTLRTLDLSQCGLNSSDVTPLFDFLSKNNHPLENLILNNNSIEAEGCISLAGMLTV